MPVSRDTAMPGQMAGAVVRLSLRRRRSRVPWVFLVYHAVREAPAARRLPAGGYLRGNYPSC